VKSQRKQRHDSRGFFEEGSSDSRDRSKRCRSWRPPCQVLGGGPTCWLFHRPWCWAPRSWPTSSGLGDVMAVLLFLRCALLLVSHPWRIGSLVNSLSRCTRTLKPILAATAERSLGRQSLRPAATSSLTLLKDSKPLSGLLVPRVSAPSRRVLCPLDSHDNVALSRPCSSCL